MKLSTGLGGAAAASFLASGIIPLYEMIDGGVRLAKAYDHCPNNGKSGTVPNAMPKRDARVSSG